MNMIGDPRLEIVLTAKEITGPAFKKVTGYAQGLAKQVFSLNGVIATLAGTGGMGYLIKQNLAAADAIAKTSDKLGISTDALQEYRYMAERSGVATRTLDMGLQRFTRRMAEAAQGSGELKGILEQYNIAVRNSNGQMRTSEDVFKDLADAIQGAESDSERLRIAFKAFDSEGAAMVNMMKNGSAGLDTLRSRYQRLGLAIDESVLRQSEKAKDSLDDLSAVLSTSVTRAVVTLAPEIGQMADNMGDWVANNKAFLSQDVPAAVKNTVEEIKNLKKIYDSIPDYITGPTGLGLIGTALLGGYEGKIIFTLSLINKLAGMTGNSIQDLVRKHKESGQAMVNLWDSIADAMGWTKEEAEQVFHPIIRDSKPAAAGASEVAASINNIRLAYMNLDAINLTDKELRMKVSGDSVVQTKAILAQEKAAWSEHSEALAADWKAAHERMYADTARMSDLSGLKIYEYGKKAVDISKDTASDMEKAFAGWANGFSSTLNDMLWEANATFGDIAESFGKMVTQMIIQKSIVEPFVNGITGSGIFANVFHSGGVVGQPAPQRVVSSDTFAGAPRLHNGLRGDEFPAILQKGETVIPKGVGTAQVNLIINNNTGAKTQVKETKNSAGGKDIIVMIDEALGSLVDGNRGKLAQSLNRRGLRPQFVGR